jgi:two-component system KDP operon response regulator KdpE
VLIECGDLKIDLMSRHITLKDVEVRLTRTEFNLLVELAKHRNQVLLHEQLLQNVWGSEYRDDVDYLRAYIRYLRRKIEADPADPKIIITHQGVGYEMVCPE